jgi:hypothetical protein
VTPRRKRTSQPSATPGAAPRTVPHGAFLDEGASDAHEHGERTPAGPREDELVGTSGSHTPAPDIHGEEPCGELAPGSDVERDAS